MGDTNSSNDTSTQLDSTPDEGRSIAETSDLLLKRAETPAQGGASLEDESTQNLDTDENTEETETDGDEDLLLDEEESDNDSDGDDGDESTDEDADKGDLDNDDLEGWTADDIAREFKLEEGSVKIGEEDEVLFLTVVGGEEEYVSLETLITERQFERHTRNQSKALADEKKQHEENRRVEQQELSQTMLNSQAVLQYFNNLHATEFAPQVMQELEKSDPARYAVQLTKKQKIEQDINAMQLQLNSDFKKFQELEAQHEKERLEAYVEEQATLVPTLVPRWTNAKVLQKELPVLLNKISKTYGFSEEEMKGFNDARLFPLFIDAVRAKAVQKPNLSGKRLPKKGQKSGKASQPSRNRRTSTKKSLTKDQKTYLQEQGGSVAAMARVLEEQGG